MAKRARESHRNSPDGSPRIRGASPFGSQVLAVFARGVEQQLGVLARKRVPTVAIVDGKEVRGIPRKVNGKYVLVPVDRSVTTRSRR